MSELVIDDEVVRWSVAPKGRYEQLRSRPLLVLMHGYGSFEGDLIGLAEQLPAHFVLASPRAPLIAPAPVVDGFAWFPMTERGNPQASEGNKSVSALLSWLDRIGSNVEGGLRRVALMGFSQGGAMVHHAMRTQPERFLAGVNCSGFTFTGEMPGDSALANSRPPVFWGRDVDDPIITPAAIARTETWLPTHSTLTQKLYPNIQHSISAEELADISEFLNRVCPD